MTVLRIIAKMERVLEERLREAVCVGDTDAVQDLVNLGVDVNTRSVNGWYTCHFWIYFDLSSRAIREDAYRLISRDIRYRNRMMEFVLAINILSELISNLVFYFGKLHSDMTQIYEILFIQVFL